MQPPEMLHEDEHSALISIRVSPESSKNAIAGFKNKRLLIAVRAAPQDGQANAAVIEVLSAIFGCARSISRSLPVTKAAKKHCEFGE